MKPHCSNRRNHALTLVETILVASVIAFFALMFLPAILARPHHRSRISCTNNLKQTWLAYKIWAGDNNDKLPFEVSTANGGCMEAAAGGNATAIFQVMSNELSTPKILICPDDKEHLIATNFSTGFSGKNISYFVGLDAVNGSSQSILSGDDNLEFGGNRIAPGLRLMSTNLVYTWTTNRHGPAGNIVLSDGMVQSLRNSDFADQILHTNISVKRLAVP